MHYYLNHILCSIAIEYNTFGRCSKTGWGAVNKYYTQEVVKMDIKLYSENMTGRDIVAEIIQHYVSFQFYYQPYALI